MLSCPCVVAALSLRGRDAIEHRGELGGCHAIGRAAVTVWYFNRDVAQITCNEMARTKLAKTMAKRPRKLLACMQAGVGGTGAYYPPHGEARDWTDTVSDSDDCDGRG